jgi:lipoate-protein ligase A
MAPVLDALRKLGLAAAIDGRNDITINGKKVSGNSQYRQKDRIIHHGTLLFDVNLDNLENSLKVSHDKLAKKGVASVRSRVTNIKELLPSPLKMDEFKRLIKEALILAFGGDQGEYCLTLADLRRIEELKRDKYETWDWNFGASPSCNTKKLARFPWGKLEILLDVRDCVIAGCKIYGDFFGRGDLLQLEKALENVPFQEDDIRIALKSIEPEKYIPGLSREVLCDLLSK